MYKELSKPLNEMMLADMQAHRTAAEMLDNILLSRAWDMVISIYLTSSAKPVFSDMVELSFVYLLIAIERTGNK